MVVKKITEIQLNVNISINYLIMENIIAFLHVQHRINIIIHMNVLLNVQSLFIVLQIKHA